jgi:hypothetical protein
LRVTTTRSRRASLIQPSNVVCSSPTVFIRFPLSFYVAVCDESPES